MKAFLATTMVIFVSLQLTGQSVLTLQPDAATGKDAYMGNYQPQVNQNFGTHEEISALTGTCGGTFCTARSLFQFNLSSIPQAATVTSAKLSLWYNATTNGNNLPQQGNNSFHIYSATSGWDESTVTWATQPSYTTNNGYAGSASISSNQDYPDMDVTGMVQSMVNNPSTNFGFIIRLDNESVGNALIFCSSDYSNSAKRPKLVVTYTLATCLTLQPDATAGKDAYMGNYQPQVNQNFGTHEEISALTGTCGGNPCTARSLFQFNLSSIPQGATITSAKLSLWYNATTSGNNLPQQGNNSFHIYSATSGWDENTVTWATQPPYTTTNGYVGSASTSSSQDYPDMDVTDMVQGMVSNPSTNFGFIIRLDNELVGNALIFCSSDYSNPAKRPKLEVCYSLTSSITEASPLPVFKVYPNPATTELNFDLQKSQEAQVEIYDLDGKVIQSHKLSGKSSIDIRELSAGFYIAVLKYGEEMQRLRWLKM